MKNNIIIHDYFENFGGGERLIQSVFKTKLFNQIIYGFDKNIFRIFFKYSVGKNLINLPIPIIFKKLILIRTFKKLKLENTNNCFISGNYAIFSNFKYVKNKIFYCHSLPKILFRPKYFYSEKSLKIILFKLFFRNFKVDYIKKLNQFDIIIANSEYTKRQMQKYTKKKIKVIYPPIQKISFKNSKDTKFQEYYLSNNRHEIEKNLDCIIKAFIKMPEKKLLLTSSGSQTNKLKNICKNHSNIVFLGTVNNFRYFKLVRNCVALINVTSNEDFGMACLEGMNFGKVTFCLNKGGYKETTKNLYNSIHVNENKITEDLVNKINFYNKAKLKKLELNCKKTAKKYSEPIFTKKIRKLLK